jgi:hypothetical protein
LLAPLDTRQFFVQVCKVLDFQNKGKFAELIKKAHC